MDVRCEQCGTEYRLDAKRIGASVTTLQCAKCGHVFPLMQRSAHGARSGSTPPPDAAANGQGQWMVRQPDGTVLKFPDLNGVRQWILERRVSRLDEISKRGETWTRLGDIVELASFFEMVEAQNTMPPAALAVHMPRAVASPSTPGGYGVPPFPGRFGSQSSPAMAQAPYRITPGQMAHATPADARMGGFAPASGTDPARVAVLPSRSTPSAQQDLDGEDPFTEWVQTRRRRMIWAVVLVLVAGGLGGGWYYAGQDVLVALRLAPPPHAVEALKQARGSWLKGGPADLASCSTKAEEALLHFPMWADALAWTSLASAMLGFSAGDEEMELAARLKITPTDAALRPSYEKAQLSKLDHFKLAFDRAREAQQRAPNHALANLAVAAYYAARHLPQQGQPFLTLAKEGMAPDEPVLAIIQAEYDALAEATRPRAVADLERVITKHPEANLARWRLAACLMVMGKKSEATAVVDAMLTATPDHPRALSLKRMLTAPVAKPENAAAAPSAAAPPPAPEAAKVDAGTPAPQPTTTNGDKPGPKATGKNGDDGDGGNDYDRVLARADRLRDKGSISSAIGLYSRAAQLKPKRAEPHVGLGWCFLDQEKPGAAVLEFNQAISINSAYSEAYLGLGEVYKFRGDKANAVKNYRKYLSLVPNGPDAEVARNSLRALGEP